MLFMLSLSFLPGRLEMDFGEARHGYRG